MQLMHTVTVQGPYDVDNTDPRNVVDSSGSIIATCSHIFLSEFIAESLNNTHGNDIWKIEEVVAA